MAIHFHNEDIDFKISKPQIIRKWLLGAIQKSNFKCGDISIVFCTDDYLLTINKQYLKHDYYTDVITFDYSEAGKISGDILISIDRIRENAQLFGVTFDLELQRILIHGILHLLGFTDDTQSERMDMTIKENEFLEMLKL